MSSSAAVVAGAVGSVDVSSSAAMSTALLLASADPVVAAAFAFELVLTAALRLALSPAATSSRRMPRVVVTVLLAEAPSSGLVSAVALVTSAVLLSVLLAAPARLSSPSAELVETSTPTLSPRSVEALASPPVVALSA